MLNNKALELMVPRSSKRNSSELTPGYLTVRTNCQITLTDAKKLHEELVLWKALFRDWYNVLVYRDTLTVTIKPDNLLWARARLPNNSFSRNDGQAATLEPKPYSPKQWHIWPKEPVSRYTMEKVIELSSNLKKIPVHYELLVRAINSFNDEYFDLAVIYSAVALERAIYELMTAVRRTKEEFADGLDHLREHGLIEHGDKRKYSGMFAKLQNDKLTLGGLLKLLPVMPFNKTMVEMERLAEELLRNVNEPRIDVLHHGRYSKRDSAHKSVTTTMNLIYGSLAP